MWTVCAGVDTRLHTFGGLVCVPARAPLHAASSRFWQLLPPRRLSAQKVTREGGAGIDKQAAEMSVWKGEIRLKNLSLKKSALDGLDLPITLVHGSLDELTVRAAARMAQN